MIDQRIERTARNLRKDVLRLLKAPKVLELRNHQRGRRALIQPAEERRNLTVSSIRGLCSDLLRLSVRPTEKDRLWSAMQRAASDSRKPLDSLGVSVCNNPTDPLSLHQVGGVNPVWLETSGDAVKGQNLKEPLTPDSISFERGVERGGEGFFVLFLPSSHGVKVAPPLDANQPASGQENRLQICKTSSTFTCG